MTRKKPPGQAATGGSRKTKPGMGIEGGKRAAFRYRGEQGPWRGVICPENYGREGTGTRDLGREFQAQGAASCTAG